MIEEGRSVWGDGREGRGSERVDKGGCTVVDV